MNKIKISADAKFCFRTDSLENWESANPILEKGEFCVAEFENGDKGIKIGDGQTAFCELAWWQSVGGSGGQGSQIQIITWEDGD